MREIETKKDIQRVENPRNLIVIIIEVSDYDEQVGYDEKGYKIIYNPLRGYQKKLY